MTHTLTESDLSQFAGGTDTFYRHALNHRVIYTSGAKHVAEAGGAYWLLDEIALANAYVRNVKLEPFQTWKLVREQNSDRAVLSCEDGNGNFVFSKNIDFTDFPLARITLWCCDNTILLPCEY
jgi:hypothetical protein